MSRIITYTNPKTGKRERYKYQKGANKGELKIFTTKVKAERKLKQLKATKKFFNLRMLRIG